MGTLLRFLGALLLAGTVSAQDNLIPVATIGALPKFSAPMLSPDGNYVAVTLTEKGTPLIAVQKLMTRSEDKKPDVAVIRVPKLHIQGYDWANNERLVLSARGTDGVRGNLLNLSRMVSVRRDGSDPVIFKTEANDFGFFRQHTYVIDWLENDPEHILAALDDEPCCWATPRVHRVNVNTGKRVLVERNNKRIYSWISDSEGVVRVGVKYDLKFSRTGTQIFYRPDEDASWETLQKTDYFDGDRLVPYQFHKDDPNILLVTTDNLRESRTPGKDAETFQYDLTERRVTEPYINAEYKQVMELLEKALPDREIDMVSWNRDKDLAFFRVYTDNGAPEYFLLDRKLKRLDFVASEYPELIDFELAPMQKVSYAARDGLEIPALLTTPVNQEPKLLPTVIYPHGGPWANDTWGFDNYVQFMANRGYVVFQPQFRGSTGHGLEHEVAGYGEWGKAIQDDISDGVKWLIEEGIADPERICIVGSSFGGYAAAVGVAKTPDLYRCAVSVNGVLDLEKYIDDGDELLFENINRKMWNSRAEAEENSPYHLAKQIKVPVLLIGSERDTVVDVKHSKRMYKRLKKYDVPVEYIELPDGEHWRTIEANELLKLTAIERFLAEHLAPLPAQTAAHQ